MRPADFQSYRSQFRAILRQVLAEVEPGRLDEAAFPAYSHPNPMINALFWERLRKVVQYLEADAPYESVLDFGCGSGVLLPLLSGLSTQVIAADIDLLPLDRVRRHYPLPPNVQVYDLKQVPLHALPAAPFDRIIATDVLEHVEDLASVMADLLGLLKPGGQIVISGPTENLFYRLGRRLAGREYSGHYHQRSIIAIREWLSQQMPIILIARLYRPITLFEIFAIRKE